MRIVWVGIKNRNLNIFGDILTVYHAQVMDVTVFFVQDTYRDAIIKRYQVPEDYKSFSLPSQRKVFIFDSPMETYESLSYLMLKELCHISIRENIFLNNLCNKATDRNYQKVDFYNSLPEKDLCILLAEKAVGKNFYDENHNKKPKLIK